MDMEKFYQEMLDFQMENEDFSRLFNFKDEKFIRKLKTSWIYLIQNGFRDWLKTFMKTYIVNTIHIKMVYRVNAIE